MTELSESARTKAARDALEEALVRLRLGKPRNPELAELAAQGKLKVTVSTVAKEAGGSRTSIGVEDCRFPDIRARILRGESGSETRPAKGLTAIVHRLSQENAELRRQVKELQSQQAVALARMLDAERVAELARHDLARAKATPPGEPSSGIIFPMPIRPKPSLSRGKR